MATDEAARLHLYEHLRGTFDQRAADTLMNALPRDPDRFATKDDLAVLEANLRAELRGANGELRGELGEAINDLQRTLFFGMLASNATLVTLAFAAARFA